MIPLGLPLQTFLILVRGIKTLKTHRHAQSSYIVTEYSKRYDTGYAVLYYDEGGGGLEPVPKLDRCRSIYPSYRNFVKDVHITFIY